MEKPLIVPIIGKARHGKDTFAEYMKAELEKEKRSVLIIRYADYLKFVCEKYMGWDGEKDEKGRNLLQFIGTDLCRKNSENVWVAVVYELIESLGNRYTHILIPDTRFENEIEYWDERGYSTVPIRVIRKNSDGSDFDNGLTPEQKEHPSETSLDGYPVMYSVESCSLTESQEGAEVVVQDILENFG